MRQSICVPCEDLGLLRRIDAAARAYRMPRSAEVASILESHFEHGNRLGETLVDMSWSLTATSLEFWSRRWSPGGLPATECGADSDGIERVLLEQRRGGMK